MSVSRVPTDPDMKRELRKFFDELERRVRQLETANTQTQTELTSLTARVTALEP